MTLKPTRSNIPHICITSIPGSQISLGFALRPAVFEIRSFWDKCTEWPQSDGEPCKVKYIPFVLLVHTRVPNFSPFCSTTSRFWDTGNFETMHRITPKWPWTLQGQVYPIYVLPVSLSPKFQSTLLCDQPFSRSGHFETIAPNDLEPYKVKDIHMYITSVPESQISVHFALRPAAFEIHFILRQMHQMTPNLKNSQFCEQLW